MALEKCRDENDKLKKELSESKETAVKLNDLEKNPSIARNPAVGTFNTNEVRPWNQPRPKTSRSIFFAKPYSAPPGLPVGLNMLYIANKSVLRVRSVASNVQNGRFDIAIENWINEKTLYAGACTWLEVEANDSNFQFGKFDTMEDYAWDNPQVHHTRLVTFPRAYSAPPKVEVWFSLLELHRNHDRRVKTYTTDVTATSCTIHIESWGDTILNFATATWVAYPADKPNIASGRFSTNDVRPSDHPQLYNNAYVGFKSNVFTSPPRVLMAINSLEFTDSHDLRVLVKASSVSAAGMTWHIDSWADTNLYSTGASYIALG